MAASSISSQRRGPCCRNSCNPAGRTQNSALEGRTMTLAAAQAIQARWWWCWTASRLAAGLPSLPAVLPRGSWGLLRSQW